ncbi:hypothetical protein NKJ90_10040 [Mesorhizobium sp. M0051]|uniref:hypothetical protein n=1 Tax=Mesorhizobium sp. M0051 TaxID=2956862 RepID=UPI003337573D
MWMAPATMMLRLFWKALLELDSGAVNRACVDVAIGMCRLGRQFQDQRHLEGSGKRQDDFLAFAIGGACQPIDDED